MDRIRLPVQRLEAQFAAADGDRESRTVPMVFYSGAKVMRFSWENGVHELTLSMEPAHVRLGQLQSGRAPFTLGHASPNDPAATIGVIENARIEAGKARADVRFSKRPEVDAILADVLDGIMANVSVGARLHRIKETTQEGDTMRSFVSTDWEPFAVALVGVGADAGAHFAAIDRETTDCEIEFHERQCMNTNNSNETAVERTRVLEIGKIAAIGKLDATFAAEHVGAGTSVEEFRRLAFEKLAERSNAQPPTQSHHAELIHDGQPRVHFMAEALAARYTGKAPSDGAREFMGARLSDMAREVCLANGVRPNMSAVKTIELAMSQTGDFPYLLQQSGRRQLMDAYTASQSRLKPACRRSEVSDFRTKSAVRLGEAPKLLLVPETGSVTTAGRAEAHESYRAYTYARIFSITRESLVNDDLGAFADFTRDWGIAAASLEADVLANLLYGPSGVGPAMADTLALFHSSHGNLAGAGATISDTTLSSARLALRTMKGVDGVTLIEVAPRFLVVPAAIETTAEKYLASLYPSAATSVNPFAQKLELIVEPRLDAKSATGWYVFGDPALAPVIEYAYLGSAPGPQVDMQNGWAVLGAEFRCVLDFGAGVIDYRGAYRNPGA